MTKLLKQTHESPIKPVNGSRKLFEPELSSGSNRRTTFVPRVSLPFRAFPRVYIYRTPRATPTFPITARRQARKMEENRGARAKLAAASPPKGSRVLLTFRFDPQNGARATRKLGGTNERASFILLITSEFAPIVGIKFVRFVSMNETHCRGISPAFLPPPLSLFRNVNREDSIRIERLLDS